MLDAKLAPLIQPILKGCVQRITNHFEDKAITPNHITVFGFAMGVIAVFFIIYAHYFLGLLFIILNRLSDGLDGELARYQNCQSNAGGYLDICLDFLFYASIPVAFAIANPEQNAVASSVLLLTFVGTGSSFLAFAISAESLKIDRPQFKNKSFYYLNGLTEGTETIVFFVLFCLFPNAYSILAYIFAIAAGITIVTRIVGGFNTIKKYSQPHT